MVRNAGFALFALVPIFVQCRSEVEALRSDAFVPSSGKLEVWHNPGYTVDVLWFPAQGVRCIMLREPDAEGASGSTTRWRMHACFAAAPDSQASETVQVPAALAARIFALARITREQEHEESELADAALAAGLFRDMSEIERFLRQGSLSSSGDRVIGR